MNFKKILSFFLLAVILVFAFWLRFNAFWLPHWKGDQNHYVALAMKLDQQGLEGYSLRQVRLGNFVLSKDPPIEFAFCKLDTPGTKGDLITLLSRVGQSSYDQPLHHRAPLFPFFLMVSHRFLAGAEKLYGVCSSNLGPKVYSIRPAVIFKTQFWAAVVPLFFNLWVVFMTFLLGLRFFNERVALYGAFLMATNPVSILLAHLLLVEDTLALFVTLSVFLYLLYFDKKNYPGIFAAGLTAGLAMLAKQTGGLLLPVAGIYTCLARRGKEKKISDYLCPEVLVYALAAFLVSGFWFWKVWKNFGHPFYQPISTLSAIRQELTGWVRQVSHRPAPFIFFTWGVISLSPVFACVFLTVRRFYAEVAQALSRKKKAGLSAEAMLWIWILAYFSFVVEPWHILALTANQEHRFFYQAYPAIALLSALGLETIRGRLRPLLKNRWIPDMVVVALLCLNAWWGIPRAMAILMNNTLLF